jgi:hypothetical protein
MMPPMEIIDTWRDASTRRSSPLSPADVGSVCMHSIPRRSLPAYDAGHHMMPSTTCANCNALLSGPYCSSCGQRADTQPHSLRHFLGEAAELLTHADSRVWATLWPLLARPGFLTREYFSGRRARYLQPFRLYLITSVLFFVLSALLGGGHTGRAGSSSVEVTASSPTGSWDCADVTTNLRWVESRLLPTLKAACRNIHADNGRAFGERAAHNIGRALFVFLPLMAALMKLLYWRPRRYYLEHLLLLIHNHAFAFMFLSIFMLATHWVSSDNVDGLLFLAAAWFMVRYLYRSIKLVYGQSRWLTVLKFSVLGCAYLVCGAFMLIATAIYSAATL